VRMQRTSQPPSHRPVAREFVRKYALETRARDAATSAERPGVDLVPFVVGFDLHMGIGPLGLLDGKIPNIERLRP